MKKFNKLFKVGTKVLVSGLGWSVVKEVHETRNWVKIEGYEGQFQRGHVTKFSNK